jgi:hypothetical protein
MVAFEQLIRAIGAQNLYYILPFLLVFTVIFAILQKTKILGGEDSNRKSFNVVVALVMSLAFVVPSITGQYTAQNDPVRILNNALPGIALTSVAIIMVLLVVGAFGKNLNIENGNAGGIFVSFSIGAVALIFAISAGWIRNLPYWLNWLRYGYNQTLIVSLLVLGAVIWFIVRDPNPEPSNDDYITFGDLLEDRDN